MHVNNELITFFRKIADDIENNELSQSELITTGEMFMTFLFRQNVSGSTPTDLTNQNMKKYLFTGWYIHSHINSNTSEPTNVNRINIKKIFLNNIHTITSSITLLYLILKS